MEEKKLLFAVLAIQLVYAGYFLLTKLAFDVGMNTFVFVFYRQAAATLFLLPIAISLERKTAPPLSLSILIKIFFLTLFGITMSLDIVGVGLKYTSASLGAATSNTLPAITFFLAVLLGMEKVKIRNSSGLMKVAGVTLCIGGVVIIAFYRGPFLKLLLHHHLIHNHIQQTQQHLPSTNTWIKGVFLMLLANLCWALWLVLQGRILKGYPSKLLLTTLQCLMSTIQSFVVAISVTRDPIEWQLGWNIRLLSVAYCGIVVTAFTFYLQIWVVEKKGPVFLAMTTPIILVFTIILSAFVLGEIISLGSVLGAILLIGGLYFVLWGKTKEEENEKEAIGDVEKACEGLKGERETTAKTAPPFSFSIFVKIFFLSLAGIMMTLNIVVLGLKYTSASMGAAVTNTLLAITFFLALLLGMEKMKIKTSSGLMKVARVTLSIDGVIIIAFCRGTPLNLLLHHHLIHNNLQQTQQHLPSENSWIKGVFLILLANLCWALWLVLQGKVPKVYPSKLLLTTLQCLMSTIQSCVVAISVTRDPIEWQLGLNLSLLSTAYCGIVVTGITFYLQAWVIEKKGPVYLAMITPLILVFTIILTTFILGEIISLGSVLGAILLIGGLWSMTPNEYNSKY